MPIACIIIEQPDYNANLSIIPKLFLTTPPAIEEYLKIRYENKAYIDINIDEMPLIAMDGNGYTIILFDIDLDIISDCFYVIIEHFNDNFVCHKKAFTKFDDALNEFNKMADENMVVRNIPYNDSEFPIIAQTHDYKIELFKIIQKGG